MNKNKNLSASDLSIPNTSMGISCPIRALASSMIYKMLIYYDKFAKIWILTLQSIKMN